MTTRHRRKKATFALDETILKDAKEIADEADYRSLNEFVETAIGEMIKRHRKKEIKRQLSAASRDHLFLADIDKAQRDFQDTDWESLEKHPRALKTINGTSFMQTLIPSQVLNNAGQDLFL